jgi:hypothetical protein
MFIFNIKTTRCRAITSKEGHELGKTIVCFVVHKTISELECVILSTLFLSVQKTPTWCLLLLLHIDHCLLHGLEHLGLHHRYLLQGRWRVSSTTILIIGIVIPCVHHLKDRV